MDSSAARATASSSTACGTFTRSYSVQRSASISSLRKPKASGCLEMMAAAMSFGT